MSGPSWASGNEARDYTRERCVQEYGLRGKSKSRGSRPAALRGNYAVISARLSVVPGKVCRR